MEDAEESRMVIEHHNQDSNSTTRIEWEGLLNWVGKHPAVCLMGALVLGAAVWATAAVVKSPGNPSEVEEVPLFI
jgi:hypothetical protein